MKEAGNKIWQWIKQYLGVIILITTFLVMFGLILYWKSVPILREAPVLLHCILVLSVVIIWNRYRRKNKSKILSLVIVEIMMFIEISVFLYNIIPQSYSVIADVVVILLRVVLPIRWAKMYFGKTLKEIILYLAIIIIGSIFLGSISKDNWQIYLLFFAILSVPLSYQGILALTTITKKEADFPVETHRLIGKYKLFGRIAVFAMYILPIVRETLKIDTLTLLDRSVTSIEYIVLMYKGIDNLLIALVMFILWEIFKAPIKDLYESTLGKIFKEIENSLNEDIELLEKPHSPKNFDNKKDNSNNSTAIKKRNGTKRKNNKGDYYANI